MKRIIIALGIMGLLVTLWTGGWLFFASQISQQVELAAHPVDPEMAAFTCEEFSVSGFPFRFDAACNGAMIAQGDLRMTSPHIKVTALAYRPTHLIAFAQSPLHISDAFYGAEQEIRFNAAKASLRLNGWQLERFSLHAEDVTYFDTLLGDILLAQTHETELHLLDIPAEHQADTGLASVAIYARIKDAELKTIGIKEGQLTAEAKLTSLPDDIRRFSSASFFEAAVRGPINTHNFGTPDIFRNWQMAGGSLILQNITASDASTTLNITGEAALDENGTINAKIEGTSDQLAERFSNFVLPEHRALFFGAAQPDGSYKQTISIVKGTVFVGIAPQGTLPPLF